MAVLRSGSLLLQKRFWCGIGGRHRHMPSCATHSSVCFSSFVSRLGMAVMAAFALGYTPLIARADTTRTQTIQFQKGWNAVFIEVTPENVDPGVVFDGAPVEIVATYFTDMASVQFIADPDEEAWTDSGWSVWYAAARPDAFLSNLHAIQANQPYLIKMSSEYTLSLEGEVKLRPVTWQPKSLNFVGFHVVPSGAPTFEEFFSGSEAHTGEKIYKLVNGHWRAVTNVMGEAIEAGRAYWVQCSKGSTYQGPLTITIPYGDTLDFGEQLTVQTLSLSNTGTVPMDITITDLGETLPLAYSTYDLETGQTTYTDFPADMTLDTLDEGKSCTLRLHVRRENFTTDKQSTILKISSGNGVVVYLAVTAQRTE